MRAGDEEIWYRAAADAVRLGADALILADFGLMAHVREHYPEQRLHVSVQASASNPEAINFLVEAFDAKRVVLPRTLTISDIARIGRKVKCEIEVFVFGGLCIMAEGRCSLSSYATGKSPNMNGVCSPASHVRYRQDGSDMVSELGTYTINRLAMARPPAIPHFARDASTSAMPWLRLRRSRVLDVMGEIEALKDAGVSALKIEGRQRGKAYVPKSCRRCAKRSQPPPQGVPPLLARLRALSEGQKTTVGAYEKRWR